MISGLRNVDWNEAWEHAGSVANEGLTGRASRSEQRFTTKASEPNTLRGKNPIFFLKKQDPVEAASSGPLV
jgi:hypothetical protein